MLNQEMFKAPLDEIIRSKEMNDDQKYALLGAVIQEEPLKIHQVFSERKYTLLHLAVIENIPLIVEQLLKLGLSPNVVDKYHKTPMHTAAYRGFEKVLNILCLDPRSNLFALDKRRNTLLHLAATKHRVQCFAILTEYVLDVDAINNKGLTVQAIISQILNQDIQNQLQTLFEKMTTQPSMMINQKEVFVEVDEFEKSANHFDNAFFSQIGLRPIKCKENVLQFLLKYEAIEDNEIKKMISIIFLYCFKMKFNNQNMIKTVYGLFDYYLPEEILLSIKRLNESLESDLLIISHYFVRHILQTCYERQLVHSPAVDKFFSEYCVTVLVKDPIHQRTWIDQLNNLRILWAEKKNETHAHISSSALSFSWIDAVNDVLDSQQDINIDQVRDIALEMRALSLELYKSAISTEFCGGHWSNETKKWQFSPILSAHSKQSDNLSKLIANVILSKKTPKKRARAIHFFIQCSKCLIDVHDSIGPDINMCMAVSGALNIAAISRLSKSWTFVPAELLQEWEEIQQFLDNKDNYQKMRMLQRMHPLSLPFLGVIKRDHLFCRTNELKSSVLSLGEFYQYLHYLRVNLSNEGIVLKSDLALILNNNSIDDDLLYQISCALEPREHVTYSKKMQANLDHNSLLSGNSLPAFTRYRTNNEKKTKSPRERFSRTLKINIPFNYGHLKRSQSIDNQLIFDSSALKEDAVQIKKSKKRRKDKLLS